MIMHGSKGLVQAIVGKMKPDGSTEMEGPEEKVPQDSDIALESAAEKAMSAIHTKDVKMLKEALLDFFELADSDEERNAPPIPEEEG